LVAVAVAVEVDVVVAVEVAVVVEVDVLVDVDVAVDVRVVVPVPVLVPAPAAPARETFPPAWIVQALSRNSIARADGYREGSLGRMDPTARFRGRGSWFRGLIPYRFNRGRA